MNDALSGMLGHPAVERALALAQGCYERETAGARAALRVLLDAHTATVDGFSGSTLSMDGFPVEFAFSSADAALRYTVDPAPPGSDPAARVDTALALLSSLATPATLFNRLAVVRQMQAGSPLQFGAFIGGRHQAATSRHKLYLEIPEAGTSAAEALATELIGKPKTLPKLPQRIEMIGLDPVSKRTEFYSRIQNMIATDLTSLLWRADLTARYGELIALLSACLPVPIWRELPGTLFGFSYSVSETGGPLIFTLYTHARSLFGGDGATRTRILGLGRERGWDFDFYERLTEPLAIRDSAITSHTMFGITLTAEAPIAVTFGVSPPVAIT